MIDFLVFAGLQFRMAGVPLVLDLHEAMPEFFRMRFPRASHPLVQRVLELQEQASILAADAVITVNDALAGRLTALGVPPGKVTVGAPAPAGAGPRPTSGRPTSIGLRVWCSSHA